VLKCRVVKEIEQSSDHLPVKTLICLPAMVEPHAKTVRFTFNEIDEELFLSSFRGLTESLYRATLKSAEKIDAVIYTLITSIQHAISMLTLKKLLCEYLKSY
jgi:hypothetical protein